MPPAARGAGRPQRLRPVRPVAHLLRPDEGRLRFAVPEVRRHQWHQPQGAVRTAPRCPGWPQRRDVVVGVPGHPRRAFPPRRPRQRCNQLRAPERGSSRRHSEGGADHEWRREGVTQDAAAVDCAVDALAPRAATRLTRAGARLRAGTPGEQRDGRAHKRGPPEVSGLLLEVSHPGARRHAAACITAGSTTRRAADVANVPGDLCCVRGHRLTWLAAEGLDGKLHGGHTRGRRPSDP
mmetsp:Transcript_61406/g.171681  ORF Transcript_61406/g.171681 Transcript_61406/m.171681 type:complete len:237 (-) Transcript_61406:324-1034(-)